LIKGLVGPQNNVKKPQESMTKIASKLRLRLESVTSLGGKKIGAGTKGEKQRAKLFAATSTSLG